MAGFTTLNGNNGRGGTWVQGTSGNDNTAGIDLSGNDDVLGMAGNDTIVDREGSNKIYGGKGSDRIVVEVTGNLILGDVTHPKYDSVDDQTPPWAAWGDANDNDHLQYHNNSEGIFVTGVNYWSTLGKELRDYGFDNAKKGGDTSAYVIQNQSERMNYWEVQEGRDHKAADKYNGDSLVADLMEQGVDIAVGIEMITGTKYRDTFLLRDHDDHVAAGGGNDYISLGKGDDFAHGQGGNDRIVTGDGKDVVRFVVGEGDEVGEGGEMVDPKLRNHDTVKDFDVKTRATEKDWDALSLVDHEGNTWWVNDAQDLADLIVFLEKDGDGSTDAIQKGNDLILAFGQGADGHYTDSITLKNVIDDLNKPEADIQVSPSGDGSGKEFMWSSVIDVEGVA